MDAILSTAFAVSNDQEQAEMLNGMARELYVRCGGRTRKGTCEGYESQCCSIARHLNADGMKFIEDLHAFIVLRREEM